MVYSDSNPRLLACCVLLLQVDKTNSHGKLLGYYVSQEQKEPILQDGIGSPGWIPTQPQSQQITLAFLCFIKKMEATRLFHTLVQARGDPALCFREHHSGLCHLGSSL